MTFSKEIDNFFSSDERGHEKILMEIKNVDSFNYNLKCLVWVNVPIAYTQVRPHKSLPYN